MGEAPEGAAATLGARNRAVCRQATGRARKRACWTRRREAARFVGRGACCTARFGAAACARIGAGDSDEGRACSAGAATGGLASGFTPRGSALVTSGSTQVVATETRADSPGMASTGMGALPLLSGGRLPARRSAALGNGVLARASHACRTIRHRGGRRLPRQTAGTLRRDPD